MKRHSDNDRGSILLMVLVVSVTLAAVVATLAGYAAGTLRYGRVTETRANRLASAQAAMDDAIERLELKRSLCSTGAGGAGDPQTINPEFPAVNGVIASVTCEVVSGAVPPADGWAIVVTGEGSATGPRLETNAGGEPWIEGPVYVFDAGTVSLAKPTTLVKGDLWHEDASCAADKPFRRSDVVVPKLEFDPTTRGTYCTKSSWQELFNVPPPVPDFTSLPVNPAPVDDVTRAGDCLVFFPGRYTTPPALADNNYFKSGNYYFDNFGVLTVKGENLTFGDIAPATDFVYPLLDENDTSDTCREERVADPNKSGATVYLDGNSQITVKASSGFEISRRRQGNFSVSLHVLRSSSSYAVIQSDPGATKDVALNGLVWAPYSKISFGTVSAKKDAAIRGARSSRCSRERSATPPEGGS